MSKAERQAEEGRRIAESNERQNKYWQRAGGHPPPEQIDDEPFPICPFCHRALPKPAYRFIGGRWVEQPMSACECEESV